VAQYGSVAIDCKLFGSDIFGRDNQFEVYSADGDLIQGKEGGSIKNGVKDICALINANWARKSRRRL
jgi:hypothetical protein